MIVKILISDLDLVVALDIFSVSVDQKVEVMCGGKEVSFPVLSKNKLDGLLFEDSKGWLARRFLRHGGPEVLARLRRLSKVEASGRPHILRMIQ